jgi:hypothetical protein
MRTIALVLLCLLSAPAFAQRVVILEFEGDRGNKLRSQVEIALKRANTVDLVPIAKWKDLASKKKLKGPHAMTPAAVAKVSRAAGVDAAVEGAIGDKLFVRILDSAGNELWSKQLPVKKGLLSEDHAKKLAKAITAAAKTAPTSTREPKEEDEKVAEEVPEKPAKVEKPPKVEKPEEEVDTDQPQPAPKPGELSASERAKRRKEEEAEAQAASEAREAERDQDLETETRRVRVKVGPKLVRVWLAGTTTWRSYCSRPGVTTCKEYDTKVVGTPPMPPAGVIVNFSPEVPYAGFAIAADVFPIAAFTDGWAQGFGLLGNFSLGFSLTNVKVTSMQGDALPKQVVSTDRSWSAQAAYRYFFSFGSGKDTLVGYAGVRGGLASRVFEIDAKAQVALPGGYRVYPQVGLDVSIPLGSKYVRVEGGFTYFFAPKPGPDEILGYGNLDDPTGGATGAGYGFEGGVSGDIWGPLGYSIKFRYARYSDRFFGQGKQWTVCNEDQCGGAAEEVYSGLIWGVTASF